MKVLNRADFMKLPDGVLFNSGVKWMFGTLKVKGETLDYEDWFERDLASVDFFDAVSHDISDAFEDMLAHGTSRPINTLYGRDGCFDDEDVFLVFERDDLLELQRVVLKALETTPIPTPDTGKEE